MKKQKTENEFDIKYIDSLFANHPDCKALPEILRFSQGIIGDNITMAYMSYLNKSKKTEMILNRLEIYFKRKEKIDKENYFQDFQMKDNKGKIFQLASLNKKLVLLDFWASDCMPCRHKHPKLADLYKKYC
jgi:thiol-disulfide isomerase/thioredoxin